MFLNLNIVSHNTMITVIDLTQLKALINEDRVPTAIQTYILSVAEMAADENPFALSGLSINETLEELLKHEAARESFDSLCGGAFFICEDYADLLQVTGVDFEFSKMNGRHPNVTDKGMLWDFSSPLQTESGSDGQWHILIALTNNSGGPTYFIPQTLWDDAKITEQLSED